ncbi:KPN_02809 family neutral zinc metallopeptidase [Paludibaculum fermentans]|uniref:Neutral zinc metallopeptidase n=1 Tax=Paludibaculum fermentans TaxID=1473598 RepID=A0A7S7NLR6_PALFE|nr:neutral zinc metallopeptidase [Paludibaculum fermentans]QOY85909.1 neutral zinc metallopeptidase [Paludibaculum fermentans]
MRWTPGGSSDDIEDRRDDGGSGGGGGGGGFGGFKLGLGGMLVLGVLSLVFKTDLISPFLGLSRGGSPGVSRRAPDTARTKSEQPLVEFVSFVLDDNQKTWAQMLTAQGKTYQKAKLVLFRDSVESACGMAESATGPFYCPGDGKVYIDLGFYDELRTKFGAPGEFAEAYVISHEIGHHIQNLLGIEAQVRSAQRRNPSQRNALSVKMELQADCFAGIWGHSTNERGILEKGDVESGLGAAAAVGDDRLQKAATGHVSPESFTHGSSAQRMEWFQRGYNSGKLSACNTFAQD